MADTRKPWEIPMQYTDAHDDAGRPTDPEAKPPRKPPRDDDEFPLLDAFGGSAVNDKAPMLYTEGNHNRVLDDDVDRDGFPDPAQDDATDLEA
jgi:hypothetical protein